MPRKPPDEPVPLEQRQLIFKAVVEAQDAGKSVAASRADAAGQFGVTEDQVKDIEREGVDRQWPPFG